MKKTMMLSVISLGVALLFFISPFSNAISSQTTRVTVSSPLFSQRMQEAIRLTPESIHSQYLGAGKTLPRGLSYSDNRIVLVKQIVQEIKTMDETRLHQFAFIIIQACKNHPGEISRRGIQPAELYASMKALKKTSDSSIDLILESIQQSEAPNQMKSNICTIQCTVLCTVGTGCVTIAIYFILVALFYIVVYLPAEFMCRLFTLPTFSS